MSDIRNIMLTGRVGREPEFKEVGGGTKLAVISLAVEQYRGPNRDADTAWWKCQIWGNRSKVAEYIKTGMRLTVSGEVTVDKVVSNKGDGHVYFYTVDVRDVILPDRSSSTSGERTQSRSRSRSDSEPETDDPFDNPDDGLPF